MRFPQHSCSSRHQTYLRQTRRTPGRGPPAPGFIKAKGPAGHQAVPNPAAHLRCGKGQESHGQTGESPRKGHKDAEGTERPSWEERPGELGLSLEKRLRESSSVSQITPGEGVRRMEPGSWPWVALLEHRGGTRWPPGVPASLGQAASMRPAIHPPSKSLRSTTALA